MCIYTAFQFDILLKKLTEGCPSDYEDRAGDVPGTGTDLGAALSLSRMQCAQKCNEKEDCLSFEHSNSQKLCNLNRIRVPTAQTYMDFSFCMKKGIVICFMVQLDHALRLVRTKETVCNCTNISD